MEFTSKAGNALKQGFRVFGKFGSLLVGSRRIAQIEGVRTHVQTVAEDYFAAIERVEQRLEVVLSQPEEDVENVKVQKPAKAIQLIERLEVPELCCEERLGVANQLPKILGTVK